MWQAATIVDTVTLTSRTRTLTLDVPGWTRHRAGQHVDVRLTAEDGYQAARSYSLASAPGAPPQITVDRLPDGEVSPYLVDVAEPGDQLEVRGPVGGYFVWEPRPQSQPPVLLVAGGSGIVPLYAMMLARDAADDDTPVRLLYSVRGPGDVIYHDDLTATSRPGVHVVLTFTRDVPAGWTGRAGRVDRAMLADVAWPPSARPDVYVCGPTGFVETVAAALVDLGHDPAAVRTERFGG
jgi:ferredoxin-NADP reductase